MEQAFPTESRSLLSSVITASNAVSVFIYSSASLNLYISSSVSVSSENRTAASYVPYRRSGSFEHIARPGSYTHLDVYKRQSRYCSRRARALYRYSSVLLRMKSRSAAGSSQRRRSWQRAIFTSFPVTGITIRKACSYWATKKRRCV